MRETCDWALWSRELARKIAEGGEQYLIDKAKSVAWQGDDGESSKTFRLLRYRDENIDPLSFFYTLASEGDLSKTKNPDRISRMYRSVAETFDMAQEPAFDHRFIFPTPPRLNSLFHKHGEGNPRLIWKLFREAVQGIESVKPDHFERALEVGNVATPKLTQALFLLKFRGSFL